ncbi:MAG TPA: class I SAM-dependent methyltransferase [Terriglobia bacterium]|nr:class I SAM-dependent methyltransferase [Terriglobia bacterium]
MNRVHRWLCRSARWKKLLEESILPSALADLNLGGHLLEVGPGPGLTTDWLRRRLPQLTAVEMDAQLARRLALRMRGSNVRVIRGDGAALPFKPDSFSAAVAFTMFHHVPSAELQDRLFQEVCRVLRPGGVFAGVDSTDSWLMRLLHISDTLVPIDPQALPARLQSAGFTRISITTDQRGFRFSATRP